MQGIESRPSVREFSPQMRFGSATSAFQVEGNVSGQRVSDWDDFIKNSPKPVVSPDEIGPDWWSDGKAEADLSRLASLGLTVQRLGFEWARIIPEKGKVDANALGKYREMIDCLTSLGFTPMVTMNHFVLPQWVAQEGGWESKKTMKNFQYYAQLLADNFGDVPYWITLNEPSNTVGLGYLTGYWPPGKRRDIPAGAVLMHGLLRANGVAYAAVKKRIPDAQVGVANTLMWTRPNNPDSPWDRTVVRVANWIYNTGFMAGSRDESDFTGVNYYTGYYLKFNPHVYRLTSRKNGHGTLELAHIPFGTMRMPEAPTSDIGWPIVPDFFLEALQYLHQKFKKPIIITENGIADKNDTYRSFYLLTHLIALHEAQRRGVDIPIYNHWASIDNQEWMEGFGCRFGLIGCDPKTGERWIRKSAQLYREIATSGVIDVHRLAVEYLTADQQVLTESFSLALDKEYHSWFNNT